MSVDHSLSYKTKNLKNILHRARLKMIVNDIKINTHRKNIISYVDIGCSNGYVTNIIAATLKPSIVIGLDRNQNHLENGKKEYPYIDFKQYDLNHLETIKDKYDLVTCFETLEHVNDVEKALINILTLCKKNGIVFLTVPIEKGLTGYLKYVIKTKIYGYNLKELGIQDKKSRNDYERDLLKNNDISKYRCKNKSGYGTHFGFDYRIIDEYLISQNIKYKAKNRFFTRFYLICNIL